MSLVFSGSQLEGTIGSSGAALYVLRVLNTFPAGVKDLDVSEVELRTPPDCPVKPSELSAGTPQYEYPSQDDSIPPGETGLIVVPIRTDKAPTKCETFFPMTVTPFFKIGYSFVDTPPDYRLEATPFLISPTPGEYPYPTPDPSCGEDAFFKYVMREIRHPFGNS